jgi:hypothetical protein
MHTLWPPLNGTALGHARSRDPVDDDVDRATRPDCGAGTCRAELLGLVVVAWHPVVDRGIERLPAGVLDAFALSLGQLRVESSELGDAAALAVRRWPVLLDRLDRPGRAVRDHGASALPARGPIRSRLGSCQSLCDSPIPGATDRSTRPCWSVNLQRPARRGSRDALHDGHIWIISLINVAANVTDADRSWSRRRLLRARSPTGRVPLTRTPDWGVALINGMRR